VTNSHARRTDYDGENVLVNSAQGRTKVENIERDPPRDSPERIDGFGAGG
jgi:hypothetical protein